MPAYVAVSNLLSMISMIAGRSFGDVSAEAVFFNLPLMIAGYLLMFVYTMLTLGKIGMVEIRVYHSMIGISSIGRSGGWGNLYCKKNTGDGATCIVS
jgi:hypothetical protein